MKTIFKVGKALKVARPDVGKVAQLLEARGYRDIDPEIAADRFVRYIASEEKCDSVGDVIKASGWKLDDWHKNPAMFADHDHSVSAKIAQGLQAFVDEKKLVVDCFYLPPDIAPNGLADACFKMVKSGFLPDCSVGPIPTKWHYAEAADRKEWGDDVWRVWDETVLKELSAVGIGALNSAKVDAVAKSLKDGTLTDDDVKALQESGSEHLAGLVERALFRVRPVTTFVPKSVVPEPGEPAIDPMVSRLEAAAKSAETAAVRLERATKLSQKAAQGLVIPLTLDAAEAILTHVNAVAELVTDLMPEPEPDNDDDDQNNQSVDPFEDSTKSADGVTLNRAGAKNAKSLVEAGKVDRDSEWKDAFGAEEENTLLGSDGDDWKNYAKWFLGIHSDESEVTKAHYAYPFGKDGKVYRSGIIACKQRAAQQGHEAVLAAATKLLDMIDKDKEGNEGKGLASELQRRLVAARVDLS